MGFTLVYGTDIARVRVLIGDTLTPGHWIEDEAITELLAIEGEVKAAAAAAAMSIAAKLMKAGGGGVVKILDLEIDTSKMASQFSALAKSLRDDTKGDDTSFDIATILPNEFAVRDYLLNSWLVEGGDGEGLT